MKLHRLAWSRATRRASGFGGSVDQRRNWPQNRDAHNRNPDSQWLAAGFPPAEQIRESGEEQAQPKHSFCHGHFANVGLALRTIWEIERHGFGFAILRLRGSSRDDRYRRRRLFAAAGALGGKVELLAVNLDFHD